MLELFVEPHNIKSNFIMIMLHSNDINEFFFIKKLLIVYVARLCLYHRFTVGTSKPTIKFTRHSVTVTVKRLEILLG